MELVSSPILNKKGNFTALIWFKLRLRKSTLLKDKIMTQHFTIETLVCQEAYLHP